MRSFGLLLFLLTSLVQSCPYLDSVERDDEQRRLQVRRRRRRRRPPPPPMPSPVASPTDPPSDRPNEAPAPSDDVATLVANARSNIVDILTNEPIFGVRRSFDPT